MTFGLVAALIQLGDVAVGNHVPGTLLLLEAVWTEKHLEIAQEKFADQGTFACLLDFAVAFSVLARD